MHQHHQHVAVEIRYPMEVMLEPHNLMLRHPNGHTSSPREETYPHPLTAADIPCIVDAVIKGLLGTQVAPIPLSDEEEEADFNGECNLNFVFFM